jgi:hypothetical protein
VLFDCPFQKVRTGEKHMAWIRVSSIKKFMVRFYLCGRRMIPNRLLNLTAEFYTHVLMQFYNLEVESICLSLWFMLERDSAVGGEVAIGTDGAVHYGTQKNEGISYYDISPYSKHKIPNG